MTSRLVLIPRASARRSQGRDSAPRGHRNHRSAATTIFQASISRSESKSQEVKNSTGEIRILAEFLTSPVEFLTSDSLGTTGAGIWRSFSPGDVRGRIWGHARHFPVAREHQRPARAGKAKRSQKLVNFGEKLVFDFQLPGFIIISKSVSTVLSSDRLGLWKRNIEHF